MRQAQAKLNMKRILLLGACYLAILGCTSVARAADLPDVADLIIYNARVLTVNSNFTVASAIAVKDGKILAVGKDRKLEEYRGPETKMVDAQDRIVMPGLYDGDVLSYTTAVSEVKGPVPDIDSISNAQVYIRKQASNTPAGTWIVLDHVSPTHLKEGRLPTKDELDAATTNHPVVWNFELTAVVNTMALTVSKIDKDTQSPPLGEVVKEPRHHQPTGLLRNATALLKLPKPDKPPTTAQERAALKRLYQLYNAQGITSIGEITASTNSIDLFRDMARSNELTVRINVARFFYPSKDADESIDRLTAFTNSSAGKLSYGPTGVGDDWVRIGPLLTITDGDSGSGTAYMRTPYGIGPTFMNDELAYRGLLLQDRFALPLVFLAAAQQGWQVETHAAGDAALDFILNAYEQVSFKFDIKDKRFLIVEPEFQAAQDWQRCHDLGVGVILKPTTLYDEGANLEKTLGDKRMTYYMPAKGWFDRDIVAGAGSGHDAGLDSRNSPQAWNPWVGMWVTLTRQTRENETMSPEEKLTREQAVRLYTFNNAWLHGEDNVKGSLEPGKYADLIMLDTDILKCPLNEIPNTKVLLTLVNGKPVWQSVEPIFPGPQVIQSVSVNAPLQPVNVAAPLPVSQTASTPTATTAPAATAAAAATSSQTKVVQPVPISAPASSAPAESATKHAADATTSVNPYSPVPDAPATPTTPAAPAATSSSAPVGAAPVVVPVAVAPAPVSTPTAATTPATSSSNPVAPATATTQAAPASQTVSTPAPASNVTAPASTSAPATTSAPASASTAPTAPTAPANAAPPVAVAPASTPAAQPAATSSDAGFTSIAGAAPAEVGASQPTASAATTVTNQAPSTVTNQAPGTISTNAANAYPASSTTFNAASTTTAPAQDASAAEAAQAAPAATGAAQVAVATTTSDSTTSSATNSATGNQDWSRVNGGK
jgi:predicted amidohydrolase YtcJ